LIIVQKIRFALNKRAGGVREKSGWRSHASNVNDDDIARILDNLKKSIECSLGATEGRHNFHDDFVDYCVNDYEVKGAARPKREP